MNDISKPFRLTANPYEIVKVLSRVILDRFRAVSGVVRKLRESGVFDEAVFSEYSRLLKAVEWVREGEDGVGWRYFAMEGGRLLLAEKLRLRSGMRVLDVGSGDGWFSIQAGFTYPNVEFHGVELSEEFAEAKEYAKVFGLANTSFYYFNAFNMPFPDRCFDRVAMFFSLANIALNRESAQRLFIECRRVLKDGGLIGISEPFLEDFPKELRGLLVRLYRLSRESCESILRFKDVEEALTEAGFRILEVNVITLHTTGSPIHRAKRYLEDYYGCEVPVKLIDRLKVDRVWVRDDPPQYRLIVAANP
ncbi:hypothetical protein DRO57_04325 [Candidatus Bathyarchaeota archaeon]|nr:MAG: hypothetical protein DRO57_04325 [Candidatus Bathyarchaeota archaeon]